MNTPHLPKLPSVQELLDHPRVRGVVERINRSTLAQRAGGYLEELRDVVAKRAGRFDVPSLGHLAERFARRLLSDPAAPGPSINATGVVVGTAEFSPPLADAAVHALVQQAGDYRPDAATLRDQAARLLCELIPGSDALLVGSVDAALVLAASALASGRTAVAVPARDFVEGAVDWTKLAARSGAVFKVQRADGSVALDGVAALFRAPEFLAVGESESAWPQTPDGTVRIDVAPLAGLLDPAEAGLAAVPTIGARRDAGADLVIADGAGLLAGPECGVIVGKPELIAALASHPHAELIALDGLVAAAFAATLRVHADAHGDAEAMRLALPVWQLLAAPLENLQQRGARLAALIEAAPSVAEATSRVAPAPWGRSGLRELGSDTVEIVVTPAEGAQARLEESLAAGPHPLQTRRDGDRLVLDLRSVFPRWDQDLVAAFESAS